MRLALEGGLRQFNLESLPEAVMLSDVAMSMGRVAPVAFRVNPDVDAGTHPYIATGLKERTRTRGRRRESHRRQADLVQCGVQKET